MRPSFWILVLWALLGVRLVAASTKKTVTNPSAKSHYKTLLSLDAGGLRLHMTNQILIELENQIRAYLTNHPELLQKDERAAAFSEQRRVYLADYFSCIAGVSGGSWVALYYASKGGNGAAAKVFDKPDIIAKYGHLYPGQAKGLDVFFEEYGRLIYPPGICTALTPRLSTRGFPVRFPALTTSLYPVWGLEKTLKLFYGDTKLSQMHTSTLVYAFDVDYRTPVLFVFDNEATPPFSAAIRVQAFDTLILSGRCQPRQSHSELSQDERYQQIRREDFFIRDLGRASSASPGIQDAMIFNAVNNKSEHYECVDGVLVTPNPTMNSLTFMLSMNTISDIQDIATLSLGTGAVIGDYALNTQIPIRWYLSQDIFRVIVYGASENVQNNLHYVFYNQLDYKEGQFRRINPLTNDTSDYANALDTFTDVSLLNTLKEIGQITARDYRYHLKHFVENFIFGTTEKDMETDKT